MWTSHWSSSKLPRMRFRCFHLFGPVLSASPTERAEALASTVTPGLDWVNREASKARYQANLRKDSAAAASFKR